MCCMAPFLDPTSAFLNVGIIGDQPYPKKKPEPLLQYDDLAVTDACCN